MMDLVEDEGLVVVGSVVLHYVIHWEEGEGSALERPKTANLSKLSRLPHFSVLV